MGKDLFKINQNVKISLYPVKTMGLLPIEICKQFFSTQCIIFENIPSTHNQIDTTNSLGVASYCYT